MDMENTIFNRLIIFSAGCGRQSAKIGAASTSPTRNSQVLLMKPDGSSGQDTTQVSLLENATELMNAGFFSGVSAPVDASHMRTDVSFEPDSVVSIPPSIVVVAGQISRATGSMRAPDGKDTGTR